MSADKVGGLYPDVGDVELHEKERKDSSSSREDDVSASYPNVPPTAPPIDVRQPLPDDPQPPETVALNIDSVDQNERKPPPYHSDPPPPYSPAQIKQTIRVAKEESSGNADFARRVFFAFFCGTVCCGIIIALHLAIPITMIVIGSMYLKDCPAQKYIPIYLVVGGCFGVVKAIINTVDQVRKAVTNKRQQQRNQEVAPPSRRPNPADGVISCFLAAWFIAGCVWIYGTHENFQSEDSFADDYCNYTLYWFAFWLTTSTFLLFLCSCCCCCVIGIVMCVTSCKS